jgi:hypothetical protein
LSYESNPTSSTASNDGDNTAADAPPQDSTTATGVGIAGDSFSDLPEMVESSVPGSMSRQSSPAAETPIQTPAAETPADDSQSTTVTPGAPAVPVAAPAAAAPATATAQSIIGSLVSTISNSARKIPLPGSAASGAAEESAGDESHAGPAGAATPAESDKSGKDPSRDKEVLLLKKTLKKKNQVRGAYDTQERFRASNGLPPVPIITRKLRSSTGSAWISRSRPPR